MNYLEIPEFSYINKQLHAEGVPVREIIRKVGTPAYILSKNHLVRRYNSFTEEFKSIPHIVYYACKSNFNINVIKLFADMGAGIDVNSEGELYRALKAGVAPGKLLLTGVGKTRREISQGIELGVNMIKVESRSELYLVHSIAKQLGKKASVALRVNPDVNALTHPYISTGQKESKFGVSTTEALELYREMKSMEFIIPKGIDMHIGSQITSIAPFKEAVERLAEVWMNLKNEGIALSHFDIGGGFGIDYFENEEFDLHTFAQEIIPIVTEIGAILCFEPGRYFTGNSAILVTEVLYLKEKEDKMILVTDAAMNDLLRPSIYGSYHHIQPVYQRELAEDIISDIVGPVCESGDFFAKKRLIQKPEQGDYLAIMSAGAYGSVMSSNYNARRRGPEVIVDGDQWYVSRSRETFEHMLYDEQLIDAIH